MLCCLRGDYVIPIKYDDPLWSDWTTNEYKLYATLIEYFRATGYSDVESWGDGDEYGAEESDGDNESRPTVSDTVLREDGRDREEDQRQERPPSAVD